MEAILLVLLLNLAPFLVASTALGGVWKMAHLQQGPRFAQQLTQPGLPGYPLPGIELPSDYNMHEVPWSDTGNSPVLVNFSINLNSILAIDEPKQVRKMPFFAKKTFAKLCRRTQIIKIILSITRLFSKCENACFNLNPNL